MKIVSLRAENYKRLKAVELVPDPDGSLVVLAGKNAQGKSSILDSIWAALAGAAGSKEVSRPIRDGETKASVELDLGELKVIRTWTAKGTSLKVLSPQGASYQKPQQVLDALLGKMSFDPLAFLRLDGKAQVQAMLSLVDLPFDPEELEGQRRAAYDARTEANREVKRLTAQLGSLPATAPDTPPEPVSVTTILGELEALKADEERYNTVRAEYVAAADEITLLNEQITALEDSLADLRTRGIAAAGALPEVGVAARRTALYDQISNAEMTNEQVRLAGQRADVEDHLKAQRQVADDCTGALETLDRHKRDGLAAAVLPVAGLGFDETGVLYNGVPLSQASGAERLKVSLGIALAANPEIRVIRVTDGSLLDSDNLKVIEEMAKERDAQVWIEVVDQSGTVGFTVEDGEIR